MDMTMDEVALYRLLSWLSPSFPVGGFSYSHGIEYAVADGLIYDCDSLTDWVAAIVAHGSGRSDAILFRAAYRAAEAGDMATLSRVAERADAMRSTTEFALENSAQGNAFLVTVQAAWPDKTFECLKEALARINRPSSLAVVVGVACTVGKVPLKIALTAYLQAFSANLVSAGVRLVPLGQTDGQRAIAALEPHVINAASQALNCPFENLGTAAPMTDWTSMMHETQYTRLFRS
jgi:urease accessory protein